MSLTFREYSLFIDELNSKMKMQVDLNDGRMRVITEVLRLHSLNSINLHLKRNKQIRDPKKIMTLPWDHLQPEKEKQNPEDMKSILKAIAKSKSKRKK